MRSRWAVWASFGSLFYGAACGESAKSEAGAGSGGDAGVGASSTGGSMGGSAGVGGAGMGQGGASGAAAGASGAQAGSGASAPTACLERTSNHTPGTRIRPRNVVTSEGDHSWQGWHDIELGQDCSFALGTDGIARCFPVASANYAPSSSFADANCTEEIVNTPSCSLGTHVSRETGATSCDRGTSRVYAAGAMVTLGTIYLGTPGACTAVPIEPPLTFLRLGAEVDPSPLVQASLGVLPGTGRVRAEGFTASDGTLQVGGWVDTEFDAKCGFESLDSSGSQYCVAEWSLSTGLAAPDCVTEVLFKTGCRDGERTPNYASLSTGDACLALRLVTVGAAFSGLVYTQNCSPFTGTQPLAYEIGEDAPPSIAPAVSRTVVLDDPGRLKPVYWTRDDGGCWFDGWFDSELGVDCRFQQFADGTYRCAPIPSAPPIDTFSDAACTVEAKISSISPCASATTPKYALRYEGVAECLHATEAWAAGDVISGADLPPLWAQTDGSCVRVTVPADGRYVTLGANVDPSTFMAGELRIE